MHNPSPVPPLTSCRSTPITPRSPPTHGSARPRRPDPADVRRRETSAVQNAPRIRGRKEEGGFMTRQKVIRKPDVNREVRQIQWTATSETHTKQVKKNVFISPHDFFTCVSLWRFIPLNVIRFHLNLHSPLYIPPSLPPYFSPSFPRSLHPSHPLPPHSSLPPSGCRVSIIEYRVSSIEYRTQYHSGIVRYQRTYGVDCWPSSRMQVTNHTVSEADWLSQKPEARARAELSPGYI